MRWQGRRGSGNIEDRRRSSGGAMIGGGGIGIVVIALLVWALGGDPVAVIEQGSTSQLSGGEITQADEEAAQFVSVVLADTEEIWADIFREQVGEPYQPTTLVLFKGSTLSGCGGANAMTGPFSARSTKKSIWIRISSRPCRANSAHKAILQQPMSLRMRSVIMFRICSVFWIRRPKSGNA